MKNKTTRDLEEFIKSLKNTIISKEDFEKIQEIGGK